MQDFHFFLFSLWLLTLSSRKGVGLMDYIFGFFISVLAGVVSNYICKWSDRDK